MSLSSQTVPRLGRRGDGFVQQSLKYRENSQTLQRVADDVPDIPLNQAVVAQLKNHCPLNLPGKAWNGQTADVITKARGIAMARRYIAARHMSKSPPKVLGELTPRVYCDFSHLNDR